jgi:hypothetical protein
VFVHVLRVDEAGHQSGGASRAYADAAGWADARLAEWLAADPHPLATRWIVLADHGHRRGGGHGDAEDEVRIVRGCLAGGLPPELPRRGALHLVDVHRALADSLALAPAADTVGRPLAFAIAHPQLGATLPRVGIGHALVAALVGALGLGLGLAVARGRWWLGPWWLAIGYGSLVLVHGPVTLSNPVVFPPLGTAALLGAAPGLAVLAVTAWRARDDAAKLVRATVVPAVAAWVAAAVGAGALDRLVGAADRPPLFPGWSAHASALASLSLAGCLVVASVLSARLALGRRPHAH